MKPTAMASSYVRFSVWLLACGLTLTFATQWRLDSFPFPPGLGEAVLLVWLGVAGHQVWKNRKWLAWGDAKPFLFFWGVVLLAMTLGFVNAVVSGVPPSPNRLHDAVAYGYCAILSVMFLVWHRRRDIEDFPLAAALALTLPLLFFRYSPQMATVAWDGGSFEVGRFVGWARNPNQTALAVLLVPMLMAHWCGRSWKQVVPYRLVLAIVIAGAALFIGWVSGSSAVKLAWAVSLPFLLLGIFFMRDAATSGRSHLRIGTAVISLVLVAGAILVALQIAQKPETPGSLPGLVSRLNTFVFSSDAGAKNKVSIRSALYRHAGEVIVGSHLIGYGPGSFSGLEKPLQDYEAHNIILDWGMSGGIVAVAALLALFSAIAMRLWRSSRYLLLSGVIALAAFAQFHHVLRHPLVWIFLAYTWAQGESHRSHRPKVASPGTVAP